MMYHTRRIDDDTYPVIRALFQRSFGVDESLSSIRLKYDTTYTGLKNIGFVAVSELDDPAAYYGVFPMMLRYESNDYVVAQSGDTMTAPEHRNKGLFVTLAQLTYKLAEEEGVQLIFGFPNQNSYPGFKKKLNWIFNGAMQLFAITCFTIPVCEMASKWKVLEPMYNQYARRMLSGYTIENTEASISCFSENTNKGFIKKDLNFIKYKLSNPDNYLIKIKGYTMLIKPKGHLIIGAVGYFEESNINDFIRMVKMLSVRLACRKVIFTLSPNHWLAGYLVKKMKPEESLPIGFYVFNDLFDIHDIEFVRADYDTF